MNNKKVIVFGFGSAGKRFARIFFDKGFDVFVYLHRNFSIPKEYFPASNFDNLSNFYCAVVASPTNTHSKHLKTLLEAQVPTIVEKPLSDSYAEAKNLLMIANKTSAIIQVGFNLRYLPVVKLIAKYIGAKKLGNILFADFYAGYYLPSWRKERDYKRSYSAFFLQGGGVSLDLIHELDMAYCLLGNVKFTQIFSCRISKLKIDAEDFVQYFSAEKPIVRVTLDYVNHVKSRRYILVGDQGSIECDIASKKFIYKTQLGKEKILVDSRLFDIEKTYGLEVEDFLRKIKNKNKIDLSERSLGIDCLQIALKGRKHVQG